MRKLLIIAALAAVFGVVQTVGITSAYAGSNVGGGPGNSGPGDKNPPGNDPGGKPPGNPSDKKTY